MGDAAAFAAMRSLLRQAGFTEEAVLLHLGIDGLAAFVPIENRALASPMDLLVRLFMDQDPVPEEAIRSLRDVLSAYLEPSDEDLPGDTRAVQEIEV